MKLFSLQEWTKHFEPVLLNSKSSESLPDIQTPLVYDHKVIEDVDVIAQADPTLVWSLIENPETGQWSIVSGLQRENILGYLVTKMPHSDANITVTVDTTFRKPQTVVTIT